MRLPMTDPLLEVSFSTGRVGAQKHTILKTSEEGLTWSQTEPVDTGGTPYIHAPITS